MLRGNSDLVNFELARVQDDFLGGLPNVGGNHDFALVAPGAAMLQVVERNVIVDWLDAAIDLVLESYMDGGN